MEQKLQTSFIPKAPIAMAPRRRGIGLLFLVSVILFLVSLLLAGGAFSYNQYFTSQVTSESTQLTAAEQQFQPATIMSLERLDQRITVGSGLLASHTSAIILFNALSASTLSSVSFSSFQMAPDGSAGFTVELHGEAQSYQALALESDALSSSGIFTAPDFSDVSLDASGQVTFTLTAQVPQSALLFSSTLSQNTLPAATQPVSTAVITTATSTASSTTQ